MCGRKKKKLLALCCLLYSSWLLPIYSGSALQAETMYQISESELTTLEQNSETLAAHSKEKDELLTTLRSQLETANKQLAESRNENEKTQESLARANESLNKLEKEAKHDIEVKARQRNIWIAVSAGLLYALAEK